MDVFLVMEYDPYDHERQVVSAHSTREGADGQAQHLNDLEVGNTIMEEFYVVVLPVTR